MTNSLKGPEPTYSIPFQYRRRDYVAHVVGRPDHRQNLEIEIEGSEIFRSCGIVTGRSQNAVSVYLKYDGRHAVDSPCTLFAYRPSRRNEVVTTGMTFNNKQPKDSRYRQSLHFFDALLRALMDNSDTEGSDPNRKVSKRIGERLETILGSEQWNSEQRENFARRFWDRLTTYLPHQG